MYIVGATDLPVKTRDGGFYIPKNLNEPPKIYEYFSVANAPVEIPPVGTDCSNIGYIRDPSATKFSLISLAVGGAAGGARGTEIGHPVARGGTNFKPAPGVGAAGGFIGVLIVGEFVNADVGNIHWSWSLQDEAFIEKLRGLAAKKVQLKELPPEMGPQQK